MLPNHWFVGYLRLCVSTGTHPWANDARVGVALGGGVSVFQRAPTLGGECYTAGTKEVGYEKTIRFNGHPPLGVNATVQQ